MKLLILFALFVFCNKTHSLTDDEEISLNNLSWLYAQFSLTFDPAEIATPEPQSGEEPVTPSEALVPLYAYYKRNSAVFDDYKRVLAFFEINRLHKVVKSVTLSELNRLLEERIKIHQNAIVAEDKVPLTFREFYTIFNVIHSMIDTEFQSEDISKITSITTVPLSHPLMQLFCHVRLNNDKEVMRSLKKFQMREFQKSSRKNNLDSREAKMLTLNDDFVEQLKGDNKDSKPKKWTTHHMIPSQTIVDFYTNYFRLLHQKSFAMLKHKRFDWIKINELMTQKVFLIDAETLWTQYGPPNARVPVNNYGKNKNSGQEDFVRAWYRWPLGLLFNGPWSGIRSDDPSNKFETFAASIVGDEYFEKAKQLNTEILEFNKMFRASDIETLNARGMKIYDKLLTIHREAPWSNQMIVPFNTDAWKFDDEKKTWSINQEYRPSWGEWGIKALAQLNTMLLTNDVNVGASTSVSAKELRRRKRHRVEEIKCNQESVSESVPENGFWCSPFYLRINPMNYIYCKLSGHKNLRFF